VTTGFLHNACCFLKYDVMILSRFMDSEASVTALKVVFFAEILQLNERISCFARKCLAEPCQHPIHDQVKVSKKYNDVLKN